MKNVLPVMVLNFICGILFSGSIIAQITIAPTNLYLDNRSNIGTYLVINGSQTAQEVTIDFIFGHNDPNASGERPMIYDDSAAAREFSAAEWIRAFPRSFTLAPGQRQVVRLRVQPPPGLAERTYWAKIKTSSQPQSAPVEQQNTGGVSARVGFKIEQVTGLYYKNGKVSTGIDIKEMVVSPESNKLLISANIERTGNSPFLGSITATLMNNQNKVITSNFVSTTIFFRGTVQLELDTNDVPAGNYKVELKFESSRSDISSSDIVQMQPATKSVNVTIR